MAFEKMRDVCEMFCSKVVWNVSDDKFTQWNFVGKWFKTEEIFFG